MKNISKYILAVILGTSLALTGCQEDTYELGKLIPPSNVDLAYEILGLDNQNPYGDGSGFVTFTASANDEITYNYIFGDGTDNEIAPDGKSTHRFSVTGINKYNVTVVAIGTGGISSSKSVQVEVYSSFSDDDAVQYLTGGSSKSWYWAADQRGHLGLGPNDQKYANNDHTKPAWYQANPFEKSASSLYDCEFVFTKTENGMTFEQKNPTGEAFIQGVYASDLGLGDEGSHTFDIGGVKNVTLSPSSSIATVDGEYRGTTMTYSGGGFMGFYCGSSQYEIIQVSENLLQVRVVQANTPLFAWYHIFTTEKPVQQ